MAWKSRVSWALAVDVSTIARLMHTGMPTASAALAKLSNQLRQGKEEGMGGGEAVWQRPETDARNSVQSCPACFTSRCDAATVVMSTETGAAPAWTRHQRWRGHQC